ncbi:MAG: hypothetical protein ACREAC_31795, partial [Blastocatellia bacterium]
MKLLKTLGSFSEDDGLNRPQLSSGPDAQSRTINQPSSPAAGISGNAVHESKRDGSGIILTWQTDLFEHGRRRAVESGAITPQD